jgi:hypothetical protein
MVCITKGLTVSRLVSWTRKSSMTFYAALVEDMERMMNAMRVNSRAINNSC